LKTLGDYFGLIEFSRLCVGLGLRLDFGVVEVVFCAGVDIKMAMIFNLSIFVRVRYFGGNIKVCIVIFL
jgi:hypothetical protein